MVAVLHSVTAGTPGFVLSLLCLNNARYLSSELLPLESGGIAVDLATLHTLTCNVLLGTEARQHLTWWKGSRGPLGLHESSWSCSAQQPGTGDEAPLPSPPEGIKSLPAGGVLYNIAAGVEELLRQGIFL